MELKLEALISQVAHYAKERFKYTNGRSETEIKYSTLVTKQYFPT
jgi:hypothetical protein